MSWSSTRSRTVVGRVVLTALIGVLALAVTGCVGPTVTDGGYRAKTAGTLQNISSALATAKFSMGLDRDGRSVFALTDTSISQAESDAASAQSSWESRQPPSSAALRLHDRVQQPIQDGVSALQDLRTAYRRGDAAGITQALAEIDKASDEIDHAIQGVSG